MIIRKAEEIDLQYIDDIYNEIFDYQEKYKNYTNWKKGLYPTINHAKTAFANSELYVGYEDEICCGSAVFNKKQLPEYAKIPWTYLYNDDEIFVIHTLVIKPSMTGAGKGKSFVEYAENLARDMKCKVMRHDTYEGNIPAIKLYLGMDYRIAGSTQFFFMNLIQEKLVCFEKKL